MSAIVFTTADGWMLAAILLLLTVLVFLALAEMSLSQLTKPRADAIAESGSKAGKALSRLAADPGRFRCSRCGRCVRRLTPTAKR